MAFEIIQQRNKRLLPYPEWWKVSDHLAALEVAYMPTGLRHLTCSLISKYHVWCIAVVDLSSWPFNKPKKNLLILLVQNIPDDY